ncbi:MAG: Vi polysaccharide biosynthesis UDP-N-acetylglucosamine C-6 dehydrogenase TviB, partial [Oligella ureolytica]|nr:Vi polysaccharide biosynthesis UDP-N-acetylglucosamine C-6 dehydrogenase TviB [Oligella ureolytica]
MGTYVVAQLIKAMTKKRIQVQESRILVMGLTFKENCPDLRNTRVVDIVNELAEYNINVDVYDPWVDPEECEREYGIKPIQTLKEGAYDGIVLAVAHEQFKAMGIDKIRAIGKDEHVLYDLKHVYDADSVDIRL